MAIKKRKIGRPKVPISLKKIGFSIKVRPTLLKAINEKTKDLNRNAEIEAILEQKYL
jgi:hypothetical protein